MEGKGWIGDIKRELSRVIFNIRHNKDEISKKLDTNLQEAKEILENLAPYFNDLSSLGEQPKILEIKTGDKEYVSVRRIEGSALENEYTRKEIPENRDEFGIQFILSLPERLLGEGQILVLATPDHIFSDCKDPLVEDDIVEQIGEEKLANFGHLTYIAMMSEKPELFKKEDWTPSWINVTLATRHNGKIYKMDVGTSVGESSWPMDTNNLQTTKEGNIEINYAGYFQSAQDISAFEDNLKVWGKVYVLNEGSSEKEKSMLPNASPSMNPSPVVSR